MQPVPFQDPMAVAKRQLDAEDYIEVLRRHKAWILGPMFACLVVGVVGAFLWPDTYVSSATIRVTPPQVPERFIPTNVNVDMNDRINSIYQSITSRTTLTNIINLYQLYPRDRKRLPIEDVIEQMRKDIKVNFVGSMQKREGNRKNDIQAFQISFAYENRLLAQKIVTELVSRFIDENIRSRSTQSLMTTDFLKEEWQKRKDELTATEQKLTYFRQQNMGRLPEERGGIQTAIGSMETRVNNLNTQINRANQDKLMYESRLGIAKEQLKMLQSPEAVIQQQTGRTPEQRQSQLDIEIMKQETSLEALKQNYTDEHPDVKRLASNIEVLKRQRDAINKQQAAATAAAVQAASNNQQRRPVATMESRRAEAEITMLQTAIEARNNEIDNYQKELIGADKNLRSLQGRMEAVPASMSDYDRLQREKILAQEKYEEMNTKLSLSQSATELENRKQGESLELLDPASLPVVPTQPKRPMVIGAAAGLGLVLGLFLAGFREMKDSTLKNLKDVRAYTKLTVLGSVPLIENDLVVRRRRRLGWLAWSTACLAGVVIMAGSIYFYYANKT